MVLIVDGASRISSTASAKRKEEGRIRIEDRGGGGRRAQSASRNRKTGSEKQQAPPTDLEAKIKAKESRTAKG